MQIEKRKRNHFFVFLVLIAFAAMMANIALSVYGLLRSWGESPSPVEATIQLTTNLLDNLSNSAATQSVLLLMPMCEDMLRAALNRNNNTYVLQVVGIWGDYGTPTPFTSDDMVIHVIFPDETHIELYYYNYTLESCRDLETGTSSS